jgi:hypothetical protein
MLAISLVQPWAWCVVNGKDIENRSWSTPYRGSVAIHASARKSVEDYLSAACLIRASKISLTLPPVEVKERSPGYFKIISWPEELACGAVIAVADLVDCVTDSTSPWFAGRYGLVLKNARSLAKPIPAKGMLGLWEWEPPEEIESLLAPAPKS